MKIENKRALLCAALLALCGFSAGILNSLLGTGGGIIITFALSRLYAKSSSYSTKDIFAMTLASVFIMSGGTCIMYIICGMLDIKAALPFLPFAFIGGAVGALLLSKLSSAVFKKIFSILVIFAGISMVMR